MAQCVRRARGESAKIPGMESQRVKILAVKLRAIGDTVIWTSALEGLRVAFPSAEIHVLTYASNAAVLENHPAVDVRHYLQSPSRWELMRTLWTLRREGFAWLLGFHATTSLCRWAWLAGARKVALHHHSWTHTPRGSVAVPHSGTLENALKRDHRVLEAMGLAQTIAPTKIYLTPDERKWAAEQIQREILRHGGNPRLPLSVFLPGAGHHLRRYPKDLWLPLVRRTQQEGRYQPVVIVDQALSQELQLREECDRLNIPLLDQGTLREFICLVSGAEVALANDSGPGHIAVALGVKTSFVFGPGCVGDWHPYDRVAHPLWRVAVSCRDEGPRDREEFQYCTVNECSHHRCMRLITIT